MSYVSSVLGRDEAVQYEANVSLLPFLLDLTFGLALFVGGIISLGMTLKGKLGAIPLETVLGGGLILWGLFVLVKPIIIKETTELVITNRRIIAKVGLVSRHTIEINLSKVESISVSQSILGRLLNYGDLEIVGTGGTREPILYISEPLMFRRKYDEILNT
jgi:uncharacterized membrane protein YdbT with pleckstrin-like domain